MNKKIAVTAALAGLMLAGCATSKATTADKTSTVTGECHGINSCKGTGDCGGVGTSCAGTNSCKGKGWVKMSKADCDAKGGTFKE
jgi:hypothetical protein